MEAMVLASITCGILGVFITRMNLSSIGVTMSHAAFAGAALGMFLGANSTLAAVAFCICIAAILGPLSDRSRMSADTTLSVLFAMSMAVAVFFIAYLQYTGKGMSAGLLLFGNVLSLYREDIYLLAIIAMVTTLFVVVFYKEILAIIFNMRIAEAAGIRAKPVYYALLFITAVSVALCMNIVGGLLIFVWLVTPAAIAYQFCFNVRNMLIAAPLVALGVSAAGVWAGFQYTLPISPLVAILFTLFFSLSVIFSSKKKVTSNKK